MAYLIPPGNSAAYINDALRDNLSIKFEAATYGLNQPIEWPDDEWPRTLRGEGKEATKLLALHDGPAISCIDRNMQGSRIAHLALWAGNYRVGTGLLVGSSAEESSHIKLETIRIVHFGYGIACPPGEHYALFDSALHDVDIWDCTYGMQLLGSQNDLFGCSFRNNQWALWHDDQSTDSIGGGTLTGGRFIGNNFDVVLNGNRLRPLRFYGTWHEGMKNTMVGRTVIGEIDLEMLLFSGTNIQPAASAGGGGVLDPTTFRGLLAFDTCLLHADQLASAAFPPWDIADLDPNFCYSGRNLQIKRPSGTETLPDFTTNRRLNMENFMRAQSGLATRSGDIYCSGGYVRYKP
jgi:hypothetical protein